MFSTVSINEKETVFHFYVKTKLNIDNVVKSAVAGEMDLQAAAASALVREVPGRKPMLPKEHKFAFGFVSVDLIDELLDFDFSSDQPDALPSSIGKYVEESRQQVNLVYSTGDPRRYTAFALIGLWRGLAVNKWDCQRRLISAMKSLTDDQRGKVLDSLKQMFGSAQNQLDVTLFNIERFVRILGVKTPDQISRLKDVDSGMDFFGHVGDSDISCGAYPCKMLTACPIVEPLKFCMAGLREYLIHQRDLEGFSRILIDWRDWTSSDFDLVDNLLLNGGVSGLTLDG